MTWIREILTRRLKLKDPQFVLRKVAPYINGHIISETLKGKDDLKRQDMIGGALDAELGSKSTQIVGMLLAYTPDEWDLDPVASPARKRSRVRVAS